MIPQKYATHAPIHYWAFYCPINFEICHLLNCPPQKNSVKFSPRNKHELTNHQGWEAWPYAGFKFTENLRKV